jgi:hypothetical protein
VLLDQRVLTADAASVTFSDISQDYDHLRIEAYVRGDTVAVAESFALEFNSDTTSSNYHTQISAGENGAANVTEAANNAVGAYVADSGPSNAYTMNRLFIPEYAIASRVKYAENDISHNYGADSISVGKRSMIWDTTDAITAIRIVTSSNNFVAGTTVRLIGIKAGQVAQVGGMTKICEEELTGTQSSFTISNIPQKYDALLIRVFGRSDVASLADNVLMEANGDTTVANYHYQYHLSRDATHSVGEDARQDVGAIPGASVTADTFGVVDVLIVEYANDKYKLARCQAEAARASDAVELRRITWYWNNTSAITSLEISLLSGDFVADSKVVVYGIGGSASLGSLPTGHIYGLETNYAAADQVTIETGSCRDASDTVDMTVDSQITIDIDTAGANGLDTGSEANSTWYYVWLIGKANGTVAGLLSTSSSSPTMPSGYLYKRLLGAVKNDSSGDFYPFHSNSKGIIREFQYDIPAGDSRILTDLGALGTSYTDCDLSHSIPTIATSQHLLFSAGGSGGSGQGLYAVPNGVSEAGAGTRVLLFESGTRGSDHFWMPVGTSQKLRCKAESYALTDADVHVSGWIFDA